MAHTGARVTCTGILGILGTDRGKFLYRVKVKNWGSRVPAGAFASERGPVHP